MATVRISETRSAVKASSYGKLKSGPMAKGSTEIGVFTGGADEDLLTGKGTPSAEDTYASQLRKANEAGKASSQKANENTRALADQQYGLLGSFATARDTKLGNIADQLNLQESVLLSGYRSGIGNLRGSEADNEKAEADNSFSNVANAIRERADLLAEAASQGAGETDLLRAQMQSLRNWSANQNEVNRAYHDTARSIVNAFNSLNSDTFNSRANIYNQAESDRESTWANYQNQVTDTWTQIANIENSNSNVDSDASTAYHKAYAQAGTEAQKAAAASYKKDIPTGLDEWDGRETTQARALSSSNKATSINLGGAQKRPEGATLRKW